MIANANTGSWLLRAHISSPGPPVYDSERLDSVRIPRTPDGSWCMSCRMVLAGRTAFSVSGLFEHRMRNRVLTRTLRLLHVVHPLDFPGTPTMMEGLLANVERVLERLNTLDMGSAGYASCLSHIYKCLLHSHLVVIRQS